MKRKTDSERNEQKQNKLAGRMAFGTIFEGKPTHYVQRERG